MAAGIVPPLFGSAGQFCWTAGILDGGSLCLLVRPDDGSPAESSGNCAPGKHAFELLVRSYGPGDAVAGRLRDHIKAWGAAGRPSTTGLRIGADPDDTAYILRAGESVIPKRWTRLVLDWSAGHS
jgi:hypothetical protein